MPKEVEKHTCVHCESTYKLLYDFNSTTGLPRFCPFCGEDTYDEDFVSEENDDEN